MTPESAEAVKVLAGEMKYPTKWALWHGDKIIRTNLGGPTLRWWWKCCGMQPLKVYYESALKGYDDAPEGSRVKKITRKYRGLTCINCDWTKVEA
jgi:hypothetical protein